MSDSEMYAAAEGIRDQATHLNVASQNWDKAWQIIRSAELPEDALGDIGKGVGYPSQFNSYAESVAKVLWQGARALGSAVNGLHQVANNYEHTEFHVTEDVKSVRDSRPDLE